MADQSIIIRHQSSVGTSTPVLIDFGTAVQRVYITAITADVLAEFNGSANTDSFRIPSGTPMPVGFEFPGSQIRTISLLGSGGTSNVYVMGVVT